MRTYVRTLLNNLFGNNILAKLLSAIVNFYCKVLKKEPKSIKFSTNLPIEDLREKKTFSFQSVSGDKIDCK